MYPVDNPDTQDTSDTSAANAETPQQQLVSWILGFVDPWRVHRDSNHKDEWDRYYRAWRAKYAADDAARKSERSKIVTPATMAAVDTQVAEIESAVFGDESYIDIGEDVKQQEDPAAVQAMTIARDNLIERCDRDKVPQNISKAFLIGAIWGTVIGKVNTDVVRQTRPGAVGADGQRAMSTNEVVTVPLIPLEPYEFIPDPTTDDIDEMLGCAHETVIPYHRVREAIRNRIYFDTKIAPYTGEDMPQGPRLQARPMNAPGVWVIEWHGKVPAKYLLPIIDEKMPEEMKQILADSEPEDNLVEAIVTIGNKSILLGAKRNPFYNEDRAIKAAQYDTIPGYFWGRGVPEKADQSQRTLDATIRARLDAMGLVSVPMMRGDVTRLPRGFNLGVWPGKFWPTSGTPKDVIDGFNLGQVNPELFAHAQDAERMVAVATGAADASADFNPNAQSATNTALNAATFLKRTKRTMLNIDRNFLQPVFRSIMWRYMQFEPDTFPQDYDFKTRAALGIMAREFEQQMLIQLLSLAQPEVLSNPIGAATFAAIIDNTSSPHKKALLDAVQAVINPKKSPQQIQQEQQQQALQQRAAVANVAGLEAKAQKDAAAAELAHAQAGKASVDAATAVHKAKLDDETLDLEHINAATELRKVAALENQNAETDDATRVRAQAVALDGLKNGIGADAIIRQADKLTARAEGGTPG